MRTSSRRASAKSKVSINVLVPKFFVSKLASNSIQLSVVLRSSAQSKVSECKFEGEAKILNVIGSSKSSATVFSTTWAAILKDDVLSVSRERAKVCDAAERGVNHCHPKMIHEPVYWDVDSGSMCNLPNGNSFIVLQDCCRILVSRRKKQIRCVCTSELHRLGADNWGQCLQQRTASWRASGKIIPIPAAGFKKMKGSPCKF